MALLFVDSFDHYATADGGKKWASWDGTISAAAKRNGVNGVTSVLLSGCAFPITGPTCIIGCACRFTSLSASFPLFGPCLNTQASGTGQTILTPTAAGALAVRNNSTGGTLLGTSAAGILLTGVWYYIEMKVLISSTVGTVEVRVDGIPVLNLTGLNTQSGASAQFNGIILSAAANNYDDLYVCDGLGSVNNDFLGDCRVEALIAQTDATAAGSNAGLTPSTGTDHGALVDDNPPNGDTDYNSGATAGIKDTYNFPALASTGAVKGIMTNFYIRKTDQALKQACPVLRHAGTDYDRATVTLPSDYFYARQIEEVNPGTAVAFTTADINALEAGVKIVT